MGQKVEVIDLLGWWPGDPPQGRPPALSRLRQGAPGRAGRHRRQQAPGRGAGLLPPAPGRSVSPPAGARRPLPDVISGRAGCSLRAERLCPPRGLASLALNDPKHGFGESAPGKKGCPRRNVAFLEPSRYVLPTHSRRSESEVASTDGVGPHHLSRACRRVWHLHVRPQCLCRSQQRDCHGPKRAIRKKRKPGLLPDWRRPLCRNGIADARHPHRSSVCAVVVRLCPELRGELPVIALR